MADGYLSAVKDLAELRPYHTRRMQPSGDYTLWVSTPEPVKTDPLCRSHLNVARGDFQ